MKSSLKNIILLFSLTIFGQTEKAKPQLIDEFGVINIDELLSRMDSFRGALNEDTNAIGIVKIYGGRIDSYFAYPYIRKAFLKAYFSGFDNPNVDRIVFENCDVGSLEMRTQLFIASPGAAIINCEENFIVPQKTVYFGTGYNYESNPYEEMEGCCDIKGSGKFIEKESLNLLLRIMKDSPENKIYVIGYAGKFSWSEFKENKKGEIISVKKNKVDSPKIADQIIEETKKLIIEKGIESSKIITINGGYSKDYRKVSIWFVPKGGEIPKPEPDYFLKKKLRKKK